MAVVSYSLYCSKRMEKLEDYDLSESKQLTYFQVQPATAEISFKLTLLYFSLVGHFRVKILQSLGLSTSFL